MVISLSPRVVKSTGDNFPDGGGIQIVILASFMLVSW